MALGLFLQAHTAFIYCKVNMLGNVGEAMKEGKIKFNTVFVSNEIPVDSRIRELKRWSKEFQRSGLTPVIQGNFTGNLSFRAKEGFIITASGLKDKENLIDDCFVYVIDFVQKTNTFYVEGKKMPSSESIMHHLIYKSSDCVNAVFHGHNDKIVTNAEKLRLPVTKKEYESGTIELATEVLKVLGKNKFVVLKNHGFVSLGENMDAAGELALATLRNSETAGLAKTHK